MIKIVLKDPDGGEAQFPVSGDMTIGRSEDCDVTLHDHKVSRNHARIFMEGPSAFIEDLGSSNGTFINDAKIEQTYPLRSGDLITIGSNRMRVTETSPVLETEGATTIGPLRKDGSLATGPGAAMHKPIPERKPIVPKFANRPFREISDEEMPVEIDRASNFWLYLTIGVSAGVGALVVYLFVLN